MSARRFDWRVLEDAGLMATGILVDRSQIAFLKHILEACEGLGFTRMVAAGPGSPEAVLAVVVTPDFATEADTLLAALAKGDGLRLDPAALPQIVFSDWFLEEWEPSALEAPPA